MAADAALTATSATKRVEWRPFPGRRQSRSPLPVEEWGRATFGLRPGRAAWPICSHCSRTTRSHARASTSCSVMADCPVGCRQAAPDRTAPPAPVRLELQGSGLLASPGSFPVPPDRQRRPAAARTVRHGVFLDSGRSATPCSIPCTPWSKASSTSTRCPDRHRRPLPRLGGPENPAARRRRGRLPPAGDVDRPGRRSDPGPGRGWRRVPGPAVPRPRRGRGRPDTPRQPHASHCLRRHRNVFNHQFTRLSRAQARYALAGGWYVALASPSGTCSVLVREFQTAAAEQRALLNNPAGVLKDRLAGVLDDDAIDSVFEETPVT